MDAFLNEMVHLYSLNYHTEERSLFMIKHGIVNVNISSKLKILLISQSIANSNLYAFVIYMGHEKI